MAGQRVYQVKIVHDVRKEALAWLSNSGLNRVLWETCELVWDSADLLSGSSRTDQVCCARIMCLFTVVVFIRSADNLHHLI